MAHGDELLSDDLSRSYNELLERRRRGEPIQYITGETEFYGLPFRVTRDVLIPRPETEQLVEKVLGLAAQVQDAGAKAQDDFSAYAARLKSCPDTEPCLSSAFKVPRIVDVGTGSGAIAVALAQALPKARITAIDISAPALAIAKENAERNGADLRFLLGDLLAPVAGERFEIIVSNPPYVAATERDTLSVEVREYEPELALFAGDDGLAVYRRLIPAAFATLTPGGFLILEIGYGQSPAIIESLTRSGFEQIEFVPDLQGIPRAACAQRPS
jgi:release factor glutamine methyltransferase